MQKRIISINVINEHSVLARISGLFAGRGYNIDSLTVAPLSGGEISKVTIATRGDEKVLEQILKQLHKLIPVLSVVEHEEMLTLELVVVKFDVGSESFYKARLLLDSLNAKLVTLNEKLAVFSFQEESSKVGQIIKALQRFLPKEIIRSGAVAVEVNK